MLTACPAFEGAGRGERASLSRPRMTEYAAAGSSITLESEITGRDVAGFREPEALPGLAEPGLAEPGRGDSGRGEPVREPGSRLPS